MSDTKNTLEELNEFYTLLQMLEQKVGGKRKLQSCHGRLVWPERGVYFFFEPNEYRKKYPEIMRVVRVGAHAISDGSRSTLWSRLKQHRGNNDGSGNHRGSIFRLHIGGALIERSMGNIQLPTWGIGSSASREIVLQEVEHERNVSEYIGQMPFLWLEIPDLASKKSHRAFIEMNSIALLSSKINGIEQIDPPSENWLGHHSRNPVIRESGLWNKNFIGQSYDPSFLEMMASYIELIPTPRNYQY